MSKRREKRYGGNGLGPHQERSPMGHATRTPTKAERRRKQEREHKQRGWRGWL